MARARALLIVLVAAVVLKAARPAAAIGGLAGVELVCRGTPFPDLCTNTAGKHAEKYKVVDAVTVLEMQVDAFKKRVKAARKLAKQEVKTSNPTPLVRRALNLCKSYYLDAGDNLGACKRAIGFRDAVTIRATMGMVQQDMQNCDEEFRKAAATANPLEDHNRSLLQMSEICRTLSNQSIELDACPVHAELARPSFPCCLMRLVERHPSQNSVCVLVFFLVFAGGRDGIHYWYKLTSRALVSQGMD